jgi:prolycopene isomerase
MDAYSQPRRDSYDAVVIGGGLGGLSAAAFLSKAGKKVLVAERADAPGGYARAFHRGSYLYDPAVHVIPEGVGNLLHLMIHILGLEDRCIMLQVDSLYGVTLPSFAFHAPRDREEYIAAHAEVFPSEADNFRRFIDLCAQMTQESQQLPPQLSLRDLDQAVQQFPTLFKYRTVTVSEVIEEYFQDPQLRALVSATWPYLGLPPSQLSFFTWSTMLSAFMVEGALYSKGSFQSLVDGLVSVVETHGSEIVVNSPAEKILVEDGHVIGIKLSGGGTVRSSVVISNADATRTFQDLVGPDNVPPPFLRRIRRLEPSLSAVVVYAATNLDLSQIDAAHEAFIYRHWSHDATMDDIENGNPGGMWVNVPTLVDPSLAPKGEHLLIFTSLAKYDTGKPWEETREQYTQSMLDALNGLYPGVCDHLTYLETATPQSFERYSGNRDGALYGWANTPGQAAAQRPNNVTPVPGLYLAGHWTQPGTGSLRSTWSGFLTAQIILGCHGIDDYMQLISAGAS